LDTARDGGTVNLLKGLRMPEALKGLRMPQALKRLKVLKGLKKIPHFASG
jgi:hypothetical protein